MISAQDKTLSIREQCELLNVSRSAWYYTASQESDENIKIMNRIDELHLDHPTCGSRMLRDYLRLEGHIVNRKRIQRLMGIMQINAIYPKQNLSKRDLENRIYPYLLRGINIDHANQVWSTDITYIRMDKGWVYLTAVIDWHTRAILSWRLSNTCDRFFCIEALEEAIAKYGKPEIFNTDQGSTFTAPDFLKVLQDNEIKISMDGKGRALDNIFIERFWRTLKQEEVYLKSYMGMLDAEKSIGRYIEHYNTKRPYSSLNGKCPILFYEDLAAKAA